MRFSLPSLGPANVAAVLSIAGLAASAYVMSGLPVPASTVFVEQRVDSVRSSIWAVSVDVIDTQRAVVALRRNVLRSEKYTLSLSLDKSDVGTQLALNRRLGEIDDELSEIDKKDGTLLDRLQSIRSAARAPAQRSP
jgi:hypothetical protein